LRAEYDSEFAFFWAIAFSPADVDHSHIIAIDAFDGNVSETGISVEGNCWSSSTYNQYEKEIYLIDCELRTLLVVNVKYFADLKQAERSKDKCYSGSFK
jgi:hypothetical protein